MNRRLVSPRTVAEATAVLAEAAAEGRRPVVVGGGTLAVPALTRGEIEASLIVDLGRIEIAPVRADQDEVRLGATATYQQIIASEVVRAGAPIVHEMAAGITGGIQIRSQGTLIGSAVAARAYSDAPTALVAHGARVTVASDRGTRSVEAGSFFVGPGRPDLAVDELVTGVSIPRRDPGGHGYYKLKFAESSWPVLTGACAVSRDGTVAVTLGGLAGVPVQLTVSTMRTPAEGDFYEQVDAQVRTLPDDLWEDIRADAGYRRRVAATVALRAYRRALSTLSTSRISTQEAPQ